MIDLRFEELMARIEERKQFISKELIHKYDTAIFKANDKIRACKD